MARSRVFDEHQLKEDFLTSTCTLKELATRHNASYSLVSKYASSQNWKRQREEHRKAAARGSVEIVEPTCSPQQHVDRSVATGDQIHQLIREATAAIKAGDIRSLKTLVDAWSSWDNQMRKAHKLDEQSGDPVVNIAVLCSLA